MTNKTIYLTVIILSVASLIGCEKKVIYATPQITGQVIDKQTNQPIEGVNTIIDDDASDKTDEQGRFTVPPSTYEYRFNKPNHREVMFIGDASFFIIKSGYGIKSYRSGGLAFIPGPHGEKRYIDMGKVYLNPVPIGKEHEYKTHFSTLDFCKPHQSQKEVDCIPVPNGKTYEEVSPNQPLN